MNRCLSFCKKAGGAKLLRIILATLFLTVGVYLSFPLRGILAIFPVMFLFSALSYWIYPSLPFCLGAGSGIAFFYALMASFPGLFLFSLVSLILCVLGAFFARGLLKIRTAKKIVLIPVLILLLVLGFLIPFLYLSTPRAYLAAKERMEIYLSRQYPDQVFLESSLYYDLLKQGYRGEVSYSLEKNVLSSTLFFSEEVEDSFRGDFGNHLLIRHKSDLIEALSACGENLITEEAGIAGEEPFAGSYEEPAEEMLSRTQFSITFRKEKTKKEDFAASVSACVSLLKEKKFVFDTITFYGQDSGEVHLFCTVTSETDPEEVLSLVRYHS